MLIEKRQFFSGMNGDDDSAGSTQLEFSDIYVNNILAKALAYAGVYMNEEGVYAYAKQYNEETK